VVIIEDELIIDGCLHCSFHYRDNDGFNICTNPWSPRGVISPIRRTPCDLFINADDLKSYYLDKGVFKRGSS